MVRAQSRLQDNSRLQDSSRLQGLQDNSRLQDNPRLQGLQDNSRLQDNPRLQGLQDNSRLQGSVFNERKIMSRETLLEGLTKYFYHQKFKYFECFAFLKSHLTLNSTPSISSQLWFKLHAIDIFILKLLLNISFVKSPFWRSPRQLAAPKSARDLLQASGPPGHCQATTSGTTTSF